MRITNADLYSIIPGVGLVVGTVSAAMNLREAVNSLGKMITTSSDHRYAVNNDLYQSKIKSGKEFDEAYSNFTMAITNFALSLLRILSITAPIAYAINSYRISKNVDLAEKAIEKGDNALAIQHYTIAAELGDAAAQRELGDLFKDEKRYALAVKWLTLAAEEGNDAEAWYYLGALYDNGYGVSKSLNKAIECYEKGAVGGNADAQNMLAIRYKAKYLDKFQGSDVERDERRQLVLNWYKKADENGSFWAKYNLGLAYQNGTLGLKLPQFALKKLAEAAVDDSPTFWLANYQLGLSYLDGVTAGDATSPDGTPILKNDDNALKHFVLAADKGHQLSAENAAKLCEQKKDLVNALKYYKIAKNQAKIAALTPLAVAI